MKTHLVNVRRTLAASLLALNCLWMCFNAPAVVQSATNVTASAVDYQCVQRSPNSRVWQRTVIQTNESGLLRTNFPSYTELATGLCYLQNNQYTDSVEQINPVADGAQAIQGQHQVHWMANANSPGGAVTLTTPDGKTLVSTVFGLIYYDSSSGSNVLLAQLQDSTATIQGPNVLVYGNAFSNLTADISYTYQMASLSQDIILRQQPPSPSAFGLNPDTTQLQVLTEFINPPVPTMNSVTNDGSEDDQLLNFGAMQMGIGQAFSSENDTNNTVSGVPVQKQWTNIENRTFLIEQVPYSSVSNALSLLQSSTIKPDKSKVRRTVQLTPRDRRKVPDKKPVRQSKTKTKPVGKALVLDYVILNGGEPYLTLQGDTTYLITGSVNISNTLTIEGGTVVKYTNNASANITTVDCVVETAPYRPAVFTSMNDNSVGQTIYASSSSPAMGSAQYLTFSLNAYSSLTFSNLRMSYASNAIVGTVTIGGTSSVQLQDCQFLNCHAAILVTVDGATSSPLYPINVYNTLFSHCYVAIDPIDVEYSGGTGEDKYRPERLQESPVEHGQYKPLLSGSYTGADVVAINVTADAIYELAPTLHNDCYATNCIFTSITNNLLGISLTNCAKYTSSSGVYQTVGAGSYYLTNGSTNRGAGTTNIPSELLSDLETKTTYAPTNNYTNTTITSDLTLTPLVPRDTNGANVDLGYHYDPIDYAVSMAVSNATITVTNGAVLAMCGVDYGVLLTSNGIFNCTGNATNLNCIVRYNTVQEQSNTNWESTNWTGSFLSSARGETPAAGFFFTEWSVLADDGQFATYASGAAPVGFQDCQFYGGTMVGDAQTILATNCLYQRVNMTLTDGGSGGISNTFFNNLFWEGEFTYSHSPGSSNGIWTFRDNLFDLTSITNEYSSSIDISSNNAYVGTSSGTLLPTNGEVILNSSPAYQTGTLGDYYYPTSLTNLIYQGSRSAAAAGLYHYTVITNNNAIEGTNTVSIGFHYVACGTNGLPLVSNTNDVPDYLADANGNGLVDSGEIPWIDFPTIIYQPSSLAIGVGSNAAFTVEVAGAPPLLYQWECNGTNISGATNATLTFTSAQFTNAGTYSVTVSDLLGSCVSSNALLTVSYWPGTLLWKCPLPTNYSANLNGSGIDSSPAIGPDGTIYVTVTGNVLYAINPSNGAVLWSNVDGANTGLAGGGRANITSSPAVGPDGTIYFGTDVGYLLAVNSNGTTLWSSDIGYASICASPAIGADGALYVGQTGSVGQIVAVNALGVPLWNYQTGSVDSSSVIGSDCTVYSLIEGDDNADITLGDDSLTAFSRDGNPDWQYFLGFMSADGTVKGAEASPAIGSDGTIYFSSPAPWLYALHPDGTLRWMFAIDKIDGFQATGGVNWTLIQSSPAIDSGGTVYFGANDNFMYAVTNGELKWVFKGASGSIISSPAVATDATVYFGSMNTNFYAVTNGGLKWVFTGATGAILSSPAIATNGTVYFGSEDGNLYAVNGSAPLDTNASWPMFRGNPQHTGSLSSSVCASNCSAPALSGAIYGIYTDYASIYVGNDFMFLARGPTNTSWDVIVSDDMVTWTNLGAITLDSDGVGYCNVVDGEWYWWDPSFGSAVYTSNDWNNVFVYLASTNLDGCCSPILGFMQAIIAPGDFLADPFTESTDVSGYVYPDGAAWPMNTLAALFDTQSGYSYYDGSDETSAWYINNHGIEQLSLGPVVGKWNGRGMDVYTEGEGGWTNEFGVYADDVTILPGESALLMHSWMDPALGEEPYSFALVGLVHPPGLATNQIVAGTNYLSSILPRAGYIGSDLNFTNASLGDQIWLWNSTLGENVGGLVPYTCINGALQQWTPSQPYLNIAQGFILVTTNTTSWVQEIPACPGQSSSYCAFVSVTNCTSGTGPALSVTSSTPYNFPWALPGQSTQVTASLTAAAPGLLVNLVTGEDCLVTTNVLLALSNIVTSTWQVSGPGTDSASGPGLTASFTPSTCGTGTLIFSMTYSNNAACGGGLGATSTVSLTNTFDVVSIGTLVPTNVVGCTVLSSNATYAAYSVSVGTNTPTELPVFASTSCPPLTATNLPPFWSLNGIQTNVAYFNTSIPGAYTVVFTVGPSSITNVYYVINSTNTALSVTITEPLNNSNIP